MTLGDEDLFDCGVPSMFGPLINAKKQGFEPKTVIDVGAFQGCWFTEAVKLYPNAYFHAFEPQWSQSKPIILDTSRQAIAERAGRFTLYGFLLGAEPKDSVEFRIHDGGSGVLKELTAFPFTTVQIPQYRLDDVIQNERPGPILMKVDVQGSELEVLKGAEKTLADTEVVILEVSTLPYNVGAPLFAEVVAFMKERGFVVWDFGLHNRRQTDDSLFQLDVFFVREQNPLRQHKQFWFRESNYSETKEPIVAS